MLRRILALGRWILFIAMLVLPFWPPLLPPEGNAAP